MTKIQLVALLFMFSKFTYAASLNDYSILLPLPSIADFTKLLTPAHRGDRGTLIPLAAFDPLPQLVVPSDNRNLYNYNLRLIAVRLDPCFNENVVQSCRRQIRMVWQPLIFTHDQVITLDASVHTFYDFDDVTWKAVVQDWKSLASGQMSDPLQIHPVLKSETLAGPFYARLQNILLKYCGEKNLTRITAMAVRGQEQVWVFEGFDLIWQGALHVAKPILIPRVDSKSQLAVFNIRVENDFFGGLNPEPNQDTNFFKLIANSHKAKLNFLEFEMKTVMAIALDYENPKIHNTANLDCVSCHLAQSARRWGEQNFSTWNWELDFKDHYASPWFRPLPSGNSFKPNQFRAFGYFSNQPVISQRVINETIQVSNSFFWAHH